MIPDDVLNKLSPEVASYKSLFERYVVLQLRTNWVAIDCADQVNVNGKLMGRPQPVAIPAGPNGEQGMMVSPVIEGTLMPSPCGQMLAIVYNTGGKRKDGKEVRATMMTLLHPKDVAMPTVVDQCEVKEPSRILTPGSA